MNTRVKGGCCGESYGDIFEMGGASRLGDFAGNPDFSDRLVALIHCSKNSAQGAGPHKGRWRHCHFYLFLLPDFLQILAGITAISKLGIDVSSIIAALATAGVAIGLALKDSMSNIASGIQIIFMHPFHVGDYISIDTTEGTVSRIELFFTALNTIDNKEIVIPNSTITASTVVNFTAMETRRLDLKYMVSYSDDLSHVKEVLSKLCQEDERILDTPEVQIVIGEHGESGVYVLIRLWCKTDDYWPIYFSMQEKVKLKFDEEGISIPFNQMDVHILNDSKQKEKE